MTYKKEYLETFLMHQTQLFDEPVAETIEEADEFLDDCMAVVADSLRDVRDYFEENGMDTAGLTKEELLEQAEESYAVANAADGVKRAAKHVAPANTENGVLRVLKEKLL